MKRCCARQTSLLFSLTVLLACMLGMTAAHSAEMLTGKPLVAALRKGGYVLIMRHASSPRARPSKATADPGNTALERQLDQKGRDEAQAMGKAIRALGIPIVDVVSSPAFRAVETVRQAKLGKPMTFRELAESEKGMAGKIGPKQAEWLRKRAEETPPKGTDTLVVTHTPNIKASFGKEAAGIQSGEALVFKPDGKGGTTLVARIKMQDWPLLASGKAQPSN